MLAARWIWLVMVVATVGCSDSAEPGVGDGSTVRDATVGDGVRPLPDVRRGDGRGLVDRARTPDRTRDRAVAWDANPALVASLFKDVHAYLTAETVTSSHPLLAKVTGVYKNLPYATFVAAVRHRRSPAVLPHTGTKTLSWTNPFTKTKETYHAHVPAKLASSKASRFPLVIWLHGAGAKGSHTTSDPVFTAAAAKHSAILVAPDSNASCDWSAMETCMSQVVYLVHHLKRRFPVDDTKVVLTGHSMGGRGSFSVGLAYPDPYCGVIPVAGTIGAAHGNASATVHHAYVCPHIENAHSLRLQFIIGDQDHPALVAQNRASHTCANTYPGENKYSELKGKGHDSPPATWSAALTWVLGKARKRYPSTVVFNHSRHLSSYVPGGLWPQTTLVLPQYWAFVDQRTSNTAKSRIKATASAGKITLETTNAKQVSIYLAQELLDATSSVTVLHKGKVVRKGKVTLDPKFLLQEARRRGERDALFGARWTLTL